MRILFLITDLGGGGAEKALIDIVNNLDTDKYDITLMTAYNEGIYRSQINSNIHYKSIIKKTSQSAHSVFSRLVKRLPKKLMYRLCIKEKYDVEIAFLEGYPVHLLSGSKCKNKIAWIHTDLNKYTYTDDLFLSHRDYTHSFTQFNKVICVSDEVRTAFINWLGDTPYPEENIQVISNYIPSESILQKASQEFDCSHKKPAGGIPVLCNLGTLKPIKGQMRLLEIHKQLLDKGLMHHLWFIGDGESRDKIKAYIKEHHLESTVTLWGFHTNPYPILRQSDIFVLPSYTEGYPLCLSEALILKKPIITTLCPGTEEILSNGEFGMITENNDEALYEGLYSVLSNSEILDELKEKARLGSKRFDSKNVLSKIEQLF